MTRVIEFAVTAVAAALTKLVCRLQSGHTAKSDETTKRTCTGIVLRCGSTVGYIALYLDQDPVALFDLAGCGALTSVLPLNIPIPVGQELTPYVYSSSGTDLATVTLILNEE